MIDFEHRISGYIIYDINTVTIVNFQFTRLSS